MKKKSSALWLKTLAKYDYLLVFFTVYFIYLLSVYPTVQSEDSGELITSALAPDIAHPPGYPLFILVGKLFSWLVPFGNMAWRINIMSGFFGAATAAILYLLIKKSTKNDVAAFGISLFYSFTNIIWGQSNRAEVYTLNTFCFVTVMWLLYLWHTEKKNKWLLWAALTFGLSIGDHHMMLLAIPAIFIFLLIENWKVIIQPKIIASCLGLLALGLTTYAYIPIRTYEAPYDNPAFIEHNGLYTWDKFMNFVNRKIYGGTVNLPGGVTQEAASEHLPAWMIGIKDFFVNYGTTLIQNNNTGLAAMLRILAREYFFLPLFFFLPGLYYCYKKDWRWATFLVLLSLCYTTVMLIFSPMEANTDTYSFFSGEPFLMPAILLLAIWLGYGFTWAKENVTNKKLIPLLTVITLVLPGLAIAKNFSTRNESHNFIAYDFNLLALESVPPNGYLLSIGRDNMTFPLYYLRKIENIRPDVNLEIYYSTTPVNKDVLDGKVLQNNGATVYIDLLPPDSRQIGLKPYNFIYSYGTPNIPPSLDPQKFVLRGIRKSIDAPNTRLAGLYFAKMGILAKTTEERHKYFDKVTTDLNSDASFLLNFLGDYSYAIGDWTEAKKIYEQANNQAGIQKVNNRTTGITDEDTDLYQAGMP